MQSYVNPIADDGDFADPFVLRFNGVYYLYCTHPQVLCWTSTDLINWELAGPTVPEDEFPGLVPFAPEVFYADGYFYMYTSPHGQGHYVLRSTSPLGPFERVTENIGRAIDGSVLIDDDGQWYFYWAGWEGIWASPMPSPTEFGEPVLTGVHLDGWTEGPAVVKRNGRYVLTYTGNHFLSPGYRVNIASSDNPLTGFADDSINPAILSADGPTVGLGHSSTVSGPDLVSTYLAYHSIRPDKLRQLNIDRLVLIEGSMQALGPSWGAVAPAAPDVECRWSEPSAVAAWQCLPGAIAVDQDWADFQTGAHVQPGAVVWEPELSGAFTTEVNFVGAGGFTASLGVANQEPALSVSVDAASHSVKIGAQSVALPAAFNFDAPHVLRLVSDGQSVTVYLDGRLQASVRVKVLAAKLSLSAPVPFRIGFVALTRSTDQLSDRSAIKPVPTRFWAGLTAQPRPTGEQHASRRVLLPARGESSWQVFAPEAGPHLVSLLGQFPATVNLTASTDLATAALTVSGTVASAVLDLPAGVSSVRVKGGQQPATVEQIDVRPSTPERAFIVRERELNGYDKTLVEDVQVRDFRLIADVWIDRATVGGHGDIIFRASQLALGYEGKDPKLGSDFLLGYSLQLHADHILVARHDYDTKVLAKSTAPFSLGGVHRVEIEVRGSHIEVDVDGRLALSVEDPLPHITGGIGLRAWESKIVAHQLEVGVLL